MSARRGAGRARAATLVLAAGVVAGVVTGALACTVEPGSGAPSRDGSASVVPPASLAAPAARPAPAPPARYGIGRAATAAEIRAWDIDVGPDGRELPPGRGTHAEGARLYAAKCAMCHGARGEGVGEGPTGYPALVGREPRTGFPFGRDPKLKKTVGNYWPYATTVYDYVRRAMPLTAPGSLTDAETYALVAWLLAENGITERDAVLDAAALRRVRMPARDRFVPDDRKGGAEVR